MIGLWMLNYLYFENIWEVDYILKFFFIRVNARIQQGYTFQPTISFPYVAEESSHLSPGYYFQQCLGADLVMPDTQEADRHQDA